MIPKQYDRCHPSQEMEKRPPRWGQGPQGGQGPGSPLGSDPLPHLITVSIHSLCLTTSESLSVLGEKNNKVLLWNTPYQTRGENCKWASRHGERSVGLVLKAAQSLSFTLGQKGSVWIVSCYGYSMRSCSVHTYYLILFGGQYAPFSP